MSVTTKGVIASVLSKSDIYIGVETSVYQGYILELKRFVDGKAVENESAFLLISDFEDWVKEVRRMISQNENA